MFEMAEPMEGDTMPQFDDLELVVEGDSDQPALRGPAGRSRPSLGSILIQENVASAEQIDEAVAEGLESGARLGEVVLRRGWINEAGLAKLIARQWDLNFVVRSMINLDDHALTLISREDAERLGACPVEFQDDRAVVAVADPSDELFDTVRELVGDTCTFIVMTPSALAQLIAECDHTPVDTAVEEAPETTEEEPEMLSVEEPADSAEVLEFDAPAPADEQAAHEPAGHDDGSDVAGELDRLLDRLAAEHVQSSGELDASRQQLAELEAEQARVQESIAALEAKIVQAEQFLSTMQEKITGLAQSLGHS
jgi:hypothetical protein